MDKGESMEGKRDWRRELPERGMHGIFLACGLAAVVFVVGITLYLVLAGLPAVLEIGLWDFLAGARWASTAREPSYGILPFLLTSVYGTLGALVLGLPVGVLTALCLSKMAAPRVAAGVRTAVELLAGIPSVVYGLVGMTLLVPVLREWFDLPSGATLLAAILVLAVMILPSVISVSTTALRGVPAEYEAASLALGATETETWLRVSLPAAGSGIAAAVVLGVGRAMGEAMAIMMVAGNVANLPGLFKSVRFLTTAIASEMAYAPVGSLQRNALYSIALVLFLFILLIDLLLHVLLKGKRRL